MENFKFPLSGNVTQTINPWEFWIRSLSSQMGLININNVTTSDANIEREIIEDVAGYGKQLGRVNDLLETLIANPGLENPTDKQQRSISEFQEMIEQINAVKQKWKSPRKLLSALDGMVHAINDLKEKHPDQYREAINKINTGLNPVEKAGPKRTKKASAV